MKNKSVAYKERANTRDHNRLVRDLGRLIEQYRKAVEKEKKKSRPRRSK